MRKLWKHEWKYHLFFLLLLLFVQVISVQHNVRGWCYFLFENIAVLQEDLFLQELMGMFAGMQYHFLESAIESVCIVILIKKALIYFVDNNSYGREFLQTLPVYKRERFCFHLLIDILTVVIALVANGIYEPMVWKNFMSQNSVEIPWIYDSYMGMTIANITYALVLLGVIYIVESFFVNGLMKIAGICGTGYLTFMIMEFLLETYEGNPIVQAIYGFFNRESIGGNYVVLTEQDGSTYHMWIHKQLNPILLWQGKQIDYSLLNQSDEELLETMTYINHLYDFNNISSYIWYVVGYVLLAMVLFIIAKRLNDRQEASREVFYFGFVKYVVSGFVSIWLYIMLMSNCVSNWHQILCTIAVFVVFVILTWLLRNDKSGSIFHTIKLVRDNG